MARQSFNDFLKSPGPSTPRGRGRGRGGRGGGGQGRGGGAFPGSGERLGDRSTQKKSFSADYSNMPFNYESLNSKGYSKLEGFAVAPFGPAGAQTPTGPRGRGRGGGGGAGGRGGRGGIGRGAFTPGGSGLKTPSGAATPVTGLGYHGSDGHVTAGRRNVTMVSGSRKDGSIWGGGAAPLFVKAGELFKQGEVDVVTETIDHHLVVEHLPLSDPSAPQMDDLRDDREVDIRDPHVLTHGSELERALSSDRSGNRPAASAVMTSASMEDQSSVAMRAEPPTAGPPVLGGQDLFTTLFDNPAPADHIDVEEMFFVDTLPAPATPSSPPSRIDYVARASAPLGTLSTSKGKQRADQASADSDEEQIIFRRRTFPQPEPMPVHPSLVPEPVSAAPPSPPNPLTAFVHPGVLSRKDKKASKRDKRGRRKGKARRGARNKEDMDGSDISRGSDGAPAIMKIEGIEVDGEEDAEETQRLRAVARDYLWGSRKGLERDEEEAEEDEEASDEGAEVEGGRNKWGDGAAETGDVSQLSEGEEDNRWVTDSSGSGSANGKGKTVQIVAGEEDDDDDEDEDEDDDDDDVEEDEDEESSELGDLTAMMDSLAGKGQRKMVNPESDDGDDDDEEDDYEALFKGEESWDEERFFLESLEDALDSTGISLRDRKARKQVFRSVLQGEADFDLPTAPAKKGKNKNKDVPPELVAQWEKDRSKKADFKRLRALERLAADLGPFPQAARKGKLKGKTARDRHMATMAHLIPRSAEEVADMFDISSDDGFAAALLGSGGRMRTGKWAMGINKGLWEVDEEVRRFLEDAGRTTMSLPAMDKEGRRKAHMLAECYGLGSKSKGKGNDRFTIYVKNSRTGLNIDDNKIASLLSASSFSGGMFYKALYSRPGGGGGGGKLKFKTTGDKGGAKIKKAGGGDRGGAGGARVREGETVGEGAERIGEGNIGHKLLRGMGWEEGGKIGRSEGGLDNPIVAIVKNTKMGLGA